VQTLPFSTGHFDFTTSEIDQPHTMLLNMGTTFDIVDREISLQRLQNSICLTGFISTNLVALRL